MLRFSSPLSRDVLKRKRVGRTSIPFNENPSPAKLLLKNIIAVNQLSK